MAEANFEGYVTGANLQYVDLAITHVLLSRTAMDLDPMDIVVVPIVNGQYSVALDGIFLFHANDCGLALQLMPEGPVVLTNSLGVKLDRGDAEEKITEDWFVTKVPAVSQWQRGAIAPHTTRAKVLINYGRLFLEKIPRVGAVDVSRVWHTLLFLAARIPAVSAAVARCKPIYKRYKVTVDRELGAENFFYLFHTSEHDLLSFEVRHDGEVRCVDFRDYWHGIRDGLCGRLHPLLYNLPRPAAVAADSTVILVERMNDRVRLCSFSDTQTAYTVRTSGTDWEMLMYQVQMRDVVAASLLCGNLPRYRTFMDTLVPRFSPQAVLFPGLARVALHD